MYLHSLYLKDWLKSRNKIHMTETLSYILTSLSQLGIEPSIERLGKGRRKKMPKGGYTWEIFKALFLS